MAAEVDMRQCWQCALWTGVAFKLIVERISREPRLTSPQVETIRRAIRDASRGVDYLSSSAGEALQLLEGVG
jgi:hypothetical protein